MKAEIKKRWVEALWSGDYTQGKATMRQGVGEDRKHCCLGVLCELYCKDTGSPWPFVDDEPTATVPDVVLEWAGVGQSREGYDGKYLDAVDRDDKKVSLADLNDRSESFGRVATVIEEGSIGGLDSKL